jgi:hypothetical protein
MFTNHLERHTPSILNLLFVCMTPCFMKVQTAQSHGIQAKNQKKEKFEKNSEFWTS